MIKAEDGRVEMNGDIIDLSMECLRVIETFCEITEDVAPGSKDVFLGCLIRYAEEGRSKND